MDYDPICQYFIYWNPVDYPGQYVVRRYVIDAGSELRPDPKPIIVTGYLDKARDVVPIGMCRMRPEKSAPPQILEIWI